MRYFIDRNILLTVIGRGGERDWQAVRKTVLRCRLVVCMLTNVRHRAADSQLLLRNRLPEGGRVGTLGPGLHEVVDEWGSTTYDTRNFRALPGRSNGALVCWNQLKGRSGIRVIRLVLTTGPERWL